MFRGSVKSTGYPLHSPVSPSLLSAVRHRVPSHFNWTRHTFSTFYAPTHSTGAFTDVKVNYFIEYDTFTCYNNPPKKAIHVQAPRVSKKFTSSTHRPPLTPRKYSWCSLLLEAELTPGAIRRSEGLSQWKLPNDTVGNRTRDLPACSAVRQPTAPPRYFGGI